MGLVALELKRRVAPGRDIAFSIVKATDLKPEDDSPEVDVTGKLAGGSLTLSEVRPETRFAAVLRVVF